MVKTYKKPHFVNYSFAGYNIAAFVKVYVDDSDIYSYYDVLVLIPSYENIVSALVNCKYTSDQVTAITLNYLLTLHEEVLEPEKVKEYQQDYKELQEYRAACKAEAKRAIEYIKENQIGPTWKDL